jgi:hypothetical protein
MEQVRLMLHQLPDSRYAKVEAAVRGVEQQSSAPGPRSFTT